MQKIDFHPKMYENNKSGTEEYCRIAAVAVLILSPLPAFLLLHKITLTCIIGILAASCGILTALPAFPPDRLPRRLAVFLQVLIALLPIPLAALAGERTLPLLYTLAVAVPLACIRLYALLRTASDRSFLSTDVPGWEVLQVYVRQFAGACPILLMAFAWSASALGGPLDRIIGWCAAVSLGVQLAVSLIRSFTRHSLLSSRFEEFLIGIIGESEPYRPRITVRVDVGQRMMFERVCRYMDEQKPFLSEFYSQDDMSQAMLTNKTYISKVINGCTGMNFSQFVNNHRVRYSMDLFRKNPRLKVTELALMSGFHNGVTYNLAFKLFVGQTPSEWCRRCRERHEGPSRKTGEGR